MDAPDVHQLLSINMAGMAAARHITHRTIGLLFQGKGVLRVIVQTGHHSLAKEDLPLLQKSKLRWVRSHPGS